VPPLLCPIPRNWGKKKEVSQDVAPPGINVTQMRYSLDKLKTQMVINSVVEEKGLFECFGINNTPIQAKKQLFSLPLAFQDHVLCPPYH
jgi:hypothetical protein